MWYAWERREKCTKFWWESLKDRDNWQDHVIGGKMGSEWILRRLAWGGLDCIQLSQDRDSWRAVVSAVMNLHVLAPRRKLISCINITVTPILASDFFAFHSFYKLNYTF
jgi:hypothetical protein